MKTDAQLKRDINTELDWEPSIHSVEINVEVKDGIVTLTGHVGSYAEKPHAELAALRVAGVKAFAVKTDVMLLLSRKCADHDIAQWACNVLDWLSLLPKNFVKVGVKDGWIMLSGQVDWQYQRVAAETAVRYLLGVKGVANEILLKPQASSTAVKFNIEAALKRNAHVNAKNISVGERGADVTLSREVNNCAKRDLARNSAWNSLGVRTVVDHMTVPY